MESRQFSYGKYGPVVFQHHRFSTLDLADLRHELAALSNAIVATALTDED